MKMVTRHVEFEAAHMLTGYNGACGRLHGHSYKLEVAITGQRLATEEFEDEDFGFIIDFKELNAILDSVVPDHMFIANGENLEGDTAEAGIVEVLKEFDIDHVVMPNSPSAENMVSWLVERINKILPKGLFVARADLWETTDSHATWTCI